MSRITLLLILILVVGAILHFGAFFMFVPMRVIVPAVLLVYLVHRITR